MVHPLSQAMREFVIDTNLLAPSTFSAKCYDPDDMVTFIKGRASTTNDYIFASDSVDVVDGSCKVWKDFNMMHKSDNEDHLPLPN